MTEQRNQDRTFNADRAEQGGAANAGPASLVRRLGPLALGAALFALMLGVTLGAAQDDGFDDDDFGSDPAPARTPAKSDGGAGGGDDFGDDGGDTGSAKKDAGSGSGAGAGKTAAKSPDAVDAKVEVTAVGAYKHYNQRQRLLVRGKRVYDMYCVGCHGNAGDGNGPAAKRLIIKPRDFTSGIYKFRSTDSSSLPMEIDLHRTIKRGLSRVSMPAFPLMPEADLLALIEYIKAFYPKWDAEAPDRKLVPVPRAPKDLMTPDRIERGRLVYLGMGCGNCHGKDGAGTGATLTAYTDAWGNPQPAFNFTRGQLKGGNNPEDIYRTFHTGLRSIMPAYGGETLAYVAIDQVKQQSTMMLPGDEAIIAKQTGAVPATAAEIAQMTPSQRIERATRNSWDLVAYIISLKTDGPPTEPIFPPGASKKSATPGPDNKPDNDADKKTGKTDPPPDKKPAKTEEEDAFE